MVHEAGMMAGCRVLEPSAGTGNLIRAIVGSATGFDCLRKVVAVEINQNLVGQLEEMRRKHVSANDDNFEIRQGDFLECDPSDLGQFDRILMNPPFRNAEDIKHIKHAIQFLKPGGVLVALCADGPRQREALESLGEYESLPAGSFAEQGTNVNVAMLVVRKEKTVEACRPVQTLRASQISMFARE
jgi:ubiquinone/menaquinone biosynthesis C-methylase UbiE